MTISDFSGLLFAGLGDHFDIGDCAIKVLCLAGDSLQGLLIVGRRAFDDEFCARIITANGIKCVK